MTVAINEVRQGMVLARPVVNEAGVTLFGKGTVVTDSVIERMRNAGASLVAVEGRPTPRMPLEEEMRLLDERFLAVDEAAHMVEIKEVVRRHIESLYGQHGETSGNPRKD